ncbi:hypothetical protein XOC_4563 [Xanthomonas oryzae pv. oryzicola BLS256]|uniref:Uncharacterized protein n=1 Tax=Xanthomonas oryzae pv. oryzicola (strain BLS256) TaxID=383407 RepID=G7TBB3_XANOB|nr:hypothetical protein XOC_4563 [Xanthomonas oryzae pv. oryzicola BLS256]QEO95154.1 hypothetical protein XOCgx_0158 [Xanthomonas oryzae pv. oryzicola]
MPHDGRQACACPALRAARARATLVSVAAERQADGRGLRRI